jgi:hypothetical protein
MGAQVTVVAHDAFAKVLSAHAGYAHAGNAAEVAFLSVRPRATVTRATRATLKGAFVAVVRASDPFTRVQVPTSHHRDHAQRADT